jgi:hypothetical protein
MIAAAVFFCRAAYGEYPFDLSQLLLRLHLSWLTFSGTGAIGSLFLFALLPPLMTALLCAWQLRHVHSESPALSLENRRVRLYFAVVITMSFIFNALPTFFCQNAICDLIPLAASMPGWIVGMPLARLVDGLVTMIFGHSVSDFRFLILVPNVMALFIFSYWWSSYCVKKHLRLRRAVIIILIGVVVGFLGFIFVSNLVVRQNTYLMSSQQLSDILAPLEAVNQTPDFQLQMGDIILNRPQNSKQAMIAQMTNTLLSHALVYCGDDWVVVGTGDDRRLGDDIAVKKYVWDDRRIRGTLPTTIVLRTRDQTHSQPMCEALMAVARDDQYRFGLDLVGKRNRFNCTSLVMYHLDPDYPGNLNFITPDFLFNYLLAHDWEIVRWSSSN